MKTHIPLKASPIAEYTDHQLAMFANVAFLFGAQPEPLKFRYSETGIQTEIAEIRTVHPDIYFDFLKWAIPCIDGLSEDDFKELLNARSAASCDSDLILINKDLENVIAQQCATSDKNSRSRSDSRRQFAARELLHNAVNGLAPAICESNPEAFQGYNNQFEQAESKIVRARAVFNQVLRT